MANQVKEKKTKNRRKVSLATAKQYLQRNDLSEIGKEENLTRGQVSNVLHGRSKNFKVAAKIIARAEQNKAIMERGASL